MINRGHTIVVAHTANSGTQVVDTPLCVIIPHPPRSNISRIIGCCSPGGSHRVGVCNVHISMCQRLFYKNASSGRRETG